ncbi:hypothetical protein ACFW6F_32025 [Streptomyces sp. NPDC058746]|uniref:hypothetical protein n=1 Tax=Streptomyces sp. NPDC058746 TaxID=3346622 RepID=UPI00369727F9
MTQNGQGGAPQSGAPWGPDQASGHPAYPPQEPGGPAYGYPQAYPEPQAAAPGHVVGPGYEGPGDPHGYGYPPLPEAQTQYIPPVPGAPAAPAAPGHHEAATQYMAPVPGGGPGPGGAAAPFVPPAPGAPAAPGHHEAATQYMAPVPGGGPGPGGAAAPFVPPVPAAAPAPAHHEAATQYVAPVPAGPGPVPPAHDEAATQYIPPVPAGPVGPGPVAPAHDEAATQYIPPVPAGPADGFDGLFRGEEAGNTQQLPPIQEPVLRRPPPRPHPPRAQGPVPPHAHQQQYQYQPQQQYAPPPQEEPARRISPGIIAAVVIGLVVVGLGVGSLLGDGKPQNNDPGAVAPAPTASGGKAGAAEAPVDPGKPQAIQLDKLLADSNDSRASVIKAVDDIKGCKNLDQAASDLRDAARQREELITRLQELKVDQLPDNARLTAALTKAWQASADADNSYAAWADDVDDDKCKDGKAKNSSHASDGNKSSGEATKAKEQAATLWNNIAAKYGLTKRDKSQL